MITLVVSASDPPSSTLSPLALLFFLAYKKARKGEIFVTTSPAVSGMVPVVTSSSPTQYIQTAKKQKKG